ncbi:MAG: glycosyltransferase family 4 protein [Nitrospira sp.]
MSVAGIRERSQFGARGELPKAVQERPMRILFIFPQVWDPCKSNFSGQFSILPEFVSGHIFTLSSRQQPVVKLGRFVLRWKEIGETTWQGIWNGLLARWGLPIRHIKRGEADVVIAYDPYACGLAGLFLKCMLGVKLIVQMNGDFHEYPPSSSAIKNAIMAIVFRLSMRWADAAKVLNGSQASYVHRLYPSLPVYQFHDYVACDFFEAALTTQGTYVLFIGHPFDLKGVDILIKAFLLIADRHPLVTLRIMGYSPEHELPVYQTLAGHHPRIEFLKPAWMEEVRDQLKDCYALVSATRTEALGRVFIEAMCCGKPIVASDTNGARICVEDGRTGLIVRQEDPDDCARQMDRLLSDPSLAERMGQAGRERARRLFSEAAYGQHVTQMVSEVMTKSIRRSAGSSNASASLTA